MPVQNRASSKHRYIAAATAPPGGHALHGKGLHEGLRGHLLLFQVAPDHAAGDVDGGKGQGVTPMSSWPTSIAAALVSPFTPPFVAA